MARNTSNPLNLQYAQRRDPIPLRKRLSRDAELTRQSLGGASDPNCLPERVSSIRHSGIKGPLYAKIKWRFMESLKPCFIVAE